MADGRNKKDGSNLDRLGAAGLIRTPHEAYASVIEGLSDDEVETILKIKRLFDDAQAESGAPSPETYFFPPF
jgi:hypothetical protein